MGRGAAEGARDRGVPGRSGSLVFASGEREMTSASYSALPTRLSHQEPPTSILLYNAGGRRRTLRAPPARPHPRRRPRTGRSPATGLDRSTTRRCDTGVTDDTQPAARERRRSLGGPTLDLRHPLFRPRSSVRRRRRRRHLPTDAVNRRAQSGASRPSAADVTRVSKPTARFRVRSRRRVSAGSTPASRSRWGPLGGSP